MKRGHSGYPRRTSCSNLTWAAFLVRATCSCSGGPGKLALSSGPHPREVVMGLFDFFRKKRPAAGSDASGPSEAKHATRHCFVLCKTAEPGELSHAGDVVA